MWRSYNNELDSSHPAASGGKNVFPETERSDFPIRYRKARVCKELFLGSVREGIPDPSVELCGDAPSGPDTCRIRRDIINASSRWKVASNNPVPCKSR